MEKGLKAFVSFIRAYKEHHCSYIFRFSPPHLVFFFLFFKVFINYPIASDGRT